VEPLAALVALGPLLGLLVLLVIRTRRLWARTPVTIEPYRPERGGDPAGDREPRRPLVPVDAGGVALPLPMAVGDDEDPSPLAPPPMTLRADGPPRGLRAS